ncbi:mechanosensitive ion channel protein MscS [Sphingobacterium faecium NBRC 15299]|uniref:mechanosensitive ion channel family protein n=1 Tax=Sphingobacterium faecium TaxID=34087 RepID=UPI000D3A64AF|nr:mechanosensitive ion channel domain-containing protein [Sphingobacterium faecium]PTX12091.1 miniconductance mechanosensitive channel [Sphingobacterium faecium]GEM63143.1 mechanosensitive ion channel protein MscS [Sphingobacterium faecium NBRC 15299]
MEKTNIINIAQDNTSSIYQWTFNLAETLGAHDKTAHILSTTFLIISAFILLTCVDYLLRFFFNSIVSAFIKKSKNNWDNKLLENKVQVHLSRFILVVISQQLLPFIFMGFPSFTAILTKFLGILMIFTVYGILNALLKTSRDILRSSKAFVDKPVDSYLQVLQIFLIFVVGTLIVSVVTGNSPWSFLVSLGAASAILMLVFKDTILGFVASIQVSANDSVRVGDWIEMPKYGVDGDILQINLNNVRIQNWDKTIVTIPTYTLLSDSFKNYRGMQESGGRRIKRSINIKISTIRYLSNEEIQELKKIALLAPYIEKREKEIKEYNTQNKVDPTVLVNGRRMTNIGLFRAYIKAYAVQNPHIHQQLTLLVRQLAPNEHGLPLELYMFTKGTQWSFFEDTMSDIFDHLFAAIKYFDLEIFELPASDDLRIHLNNKAVTSTLAQ